MPSRPIRDPDRGKFTAEFHRRLFGCFLNHTLDQSPSKNVLWGMLDAVYEAGSARFTNADALTLTVVIESLLNTEFSHLGVLPEDERAAVDELRHEIESWNGNQRIKKRALGLLGMLSDPGPKGRMIELEDNGVITREQRNAWSDLRNLSTHRYLASGKPAPELWGLLAKCQVLFYHLLFAAIGYRGPYTDYASPGRPLRRFPERTSWL